MTPRLLPNYRVHLTPATPSSRFQGTNRSIKCLSLKNDDRAPPPSKSSPTTPVTTPDNSLKYKAMAALASIGAIETAYLTIEKFLGGDVICPLTSEVATCNSVLTSQYATLPIANIPLSALGVVAYSATAILAVLGARAIDKAELNTELSVQKATLTSGALLAGTSGYLMYVLLSAFPGQVCPWCVGSAAISFTIAALSVANLRSRRDMVEAVGPGAGLATLTLALLSFTLGNPSQAGDAITELPFRNPEVSEHSSKKAVEVAKKLKAAGAKMYGAFWCSHCFSQKQSFGVEAMADFPYVECFPDGWSRGQSVADVCKNTRGGPLEGFPTWIITDKTRLIGEQSLEQLEEALQSVK